MKVAYSINRIRDVVMEPLKLEQTSESPTLHTFPENIYDRIHAEKTRSYR